MFSINVKEIINVIIFRLFFFLRFIIFGSYETESIKFNLRHQNKIFLSRKLKLDVSLCRIYFITYQY